MGPRFYSLLPAFDCIFIFHALLTPLIVSLALRKLSLPKKNEHHRAPSQWIFSNPKCDTDKRSSADSIEARRLDVLRLPASLLLFCLTQVNPCL